MIFALSIPTILGISSVAYFFLEGGRLYVGLASLSMFNEIKKEMWSKVVRRAGYSGSFLFRDKIT